MMNAFDRQVIDKQRSDISALPLQQIGTGQQVAQLLVAVAACLEEIDRLVAVLRRIDRAAAARVGQGNSRLLVEIAREVRESLG